MEEVMIKNEFDHSYIMIHAAKEVQQTYPFQMITQNTIPGFLSCKLRYIEEDAYYSYDITSKRSLEKEYQEAKMGFMDVKDLFYSMNRILKKASEFLLEKEGFVLDPQYIFRDLETEEMSCLYLPELLAKEEGNAKGKYRELADFLLDKTDHKDEHAVNTVYQFYKMSKEEYFSFDSFVGFMEKEELLLQAEQRRKEERREKASPPENNRLSLEEEIEERQIPEIGKKKSSNLFAFLWISGILFAVGFIVTAAYVCVPSLRSLALYLLIPGISMMGMAVILAVRSMYSFYQNKKEEEWQEPQTPVTVEDYFDDILDRETVYFDEDMYYCLKWKEGHFSREFHLTEFPVTVGKMKESVELHIEDASVSRLHARFKEKGNAIVLQDLDSTNGTVVNGTRLAAGEEITIRRNDEIQFGKIIVNVV